jgi:hypothetical protein
VIYLTQARLKAIGTQWLRALRLVDTEQGLKSWSQRMWRGAAAGYPGYSVFSLGEHGDTDVLFYSNLAEFGLSEFSGNPPPNNLGNPSLFQTLILRKLLSVCPELTDGHIKIVAYRSHDVTRSVGETALYSSQIIGAIAKGVR